MTPWGDIAGGFFIGYLLDHAKLSVKQRARLSFIFLMVLNLALWIWTAIVTKQLEEQKPVIDWTSGSMFGKTLSLFVLFEFATMATQTSLYWIISHSGLSPQYFSVLKKLTILPVSDDFIVLSYMTGILRGVECAGQAVAYGIKSSDTTDWISIGLNVGLSKYSAVIEFPISLMLL